MEDVLEQLVGKIEDEFDHEEPEAFVEEDGRLIVDGQAPIRSLAERLGFELETHSETTVGGYLSEYVARVPQAGERLEMHGHQIEVLEVDETKVCRLAISELEGESSPSD